MVVPPNPPEFWETLTGATPGVSESNCVKFLPFERQVDNLLLGYHRTQLGCRTLDLSADSFNRNFLADFADLQRHVECCVSDSPST